MKYTFLIMLVIRGFIVQAQSVIERVESEKDIFQRVDTVINDLSIHWTFKAIPEDFVIQEYQNGKKLYRYYYRNTEFKIVLPNSELSFNKMSFRDSIKYDYSSEFRLRYIRFEGFIEQTSELKFFLTISKPDTDWTYPIYLFVNLNGRNRFLMPKFDDY